MSNVLPQVMEKGLSALEFFTYIVRVENAKSFSVDEAVLLL